MKNGIVTNATDWRSQALQGYCKFQGLPISIENERGSYRQGKEPNGRMWRTFMHITYGYIRLTEGTDGDHVDCYIGPIKTSDRVFIVHQQVPETKAYDEDKVMLGFNSGADAKAAYVRQYDRPGFFQSMEEHDMATFKQMLKDRKGMKLKKSWDDDDEEDDDEEESERDKEFEKERLAEEAKDRRPKKFTKAKKTVAIDFDGVLNSYSGGWKGASKTDAPVSGAAEAIRAIREFGYDVSIYSTRASTKEGVQAIRNFCTEKLDIEASEMVITDRKPIAEAYIDDRAINFSGDWKSTINKLKHFKSWLDPVEKAKRMPIGTISHGRKKMAEGRWVPVRTMRKPTWKVLARHKWVAGAVITESDSPEKGTAKSAYRRFTATIRGYQNFKIYEGFLSSGTGDKVRKQVSRLRDRIDAGDEDVFHEDTRVGKVDKEKKLAPAPEFTVQQNLGGTTGGALLITMANGEQKVMKHSTTPKHLLEEYTANRIYKILGTPVPDVTLYSTNKGPAQVADWVKGIPLSNLDDEVRAEAIESLKRGFVADALLGNWDVLGLDEDNILWDGGKAWRIDNGGAMRYRAQGASKGEAFGTEVGEIDTLRDLGHGAGRIFHTVTEVEIADQVQSVMVHKEAILQAIEDPSLRITMEARIGSLEEYLVPTAKARFPDMSLIKSNAGIWYLYENGKLTRFWWFHDLEKAIKTKSYYSPEEVKARGMRWVTIRGARVLVQGVSGGGWVVVGGAGGKLNHLKIDRILSKEEYAAKRKQVEKKRKEELRALTTEELAEQAAQRKVEMKAKRAARTQYTEVVASALGITTVGMRSEISAQEVDKLAAKAREMVEARAKKPKDLEAAVRVETQKEIDRIVAQKVKSVERQALEVLMNDYAPTDPNAAPYFKNLLNKDVALEVLAARKQFKETVKEIGKGQADIPTSLKVGDILAGSSRSLDKDILDEVKQRIETQKNIRLYDTLNAQSLTIQKHIDQGSISSLNGLVGDLYGVGATFSTSTIENLGLEAVVRAVTIKIQQDGRGEEVRKALEEYASKEREKVVTEALQESELRFKNADQLRSLARDTDDAEAILSMASANGHALKQLTAGQRALGTAVGSLRAVAGMINALEDPPADVIQIDIGKDLVRARKKAREAGLPKGSYSIKTMKEGRAKRLVLEIKKGNLDTFFQRNEDMRKEESTVDRIKRHEANNGYKPPGVKENITFDAAQEAGLRFFMERDNVILDFEAGLGKTGVAYAAIMEAMKNKGAKKVLVVTPAKTRGDFKNQAGTFLDKDMQKLVRSSTENTPRNERRARHEAEEGIHIISQDSLREDAESIKAAGYDMIVVDEIHEMTAGTGQAGRFKALMGLTDIPLKVAMSGTNIKNKKSELYRKINFIDPDHTLGSMAEFDKRYKGLNQGTGMFSDAANDAFRKEISQWVYTQKNALPVENTVTTDRLPMTTQQRKAYAASERKYRDAREKKIPGAAAQRDVRNYEIITDGDDMNNAKLNRMVDVMKTKHPGEKAVIHISRPGVPVLKAMQTAERRIKAEFGEGSVGSIHGESSPGHVTDLKKRFNDPEDPLRFIIGTKSLESGHNLQGGGTVTFHLDIPDSYASFEQRNARIHRKGQDRDTKTYVLSGTNPYDMRGEDILETKRKEQSILGNPREIEAMDDTGFLGILNKYEQEGRRASA